jgi:hypothetical protein
MSILTEEQARELRADMREAFELATARHEHTYGKPDTGPRWMQSEVAVAFFHAIREQRQQNIYFDAHNFIQPGNDEGDAT